MSSNNKSTRRTAARKDMTALHLKGAKGSARTEPKHGKARANRADCNVMPRRMKASTGILRRAA
jgi:hypothetical protein